MIPTKKSITTVEELSKNDLVSKDELQELEKVAKRYDVAITPLLVDLIEKADQNDPIRKQFVPSLQELHQLDSENVDPVGDLKHTKVKGLVHRYPDRCLLKPVTVCPVYCRFCFRREQVGAGSEAMSKSDLNRAYQYITEHAEIWEVILTGGDPLILKPSALTQIIRNLAAISHVEVVRIHTRVPIVSPERICEALITALRCDKAVYIVVHANHPKEFTSQAIKACANLVDAGIPLLSQSVLLKGVNDNMSTLQELMRTFVRNRIKPYYLHHADLANGTQHFRTSIASGQQLMKALRGTISGLCVPHYMLDIPGGYGKVPIGPGYVRETSEGLMVEDFCGVAHSYQEDE